MPVKVLIPSSSEEFPPETKSLTVKGGSIREIIEHALDQFQSLRSLVLDQKGKTRQSVRIYLNEEDMRYLNGMETEAKDGDTVVILTSTLPEDD